MSDLVRKVSKVRREQGHAPDSSFVAQKGIYTSRQSGETVVEDGGQVFILGLGEALQDFKREMITLGEALARELRQEMVIVELQRDGVTLKTFLVSP